MASGRGFVQVQGLRAALQSAARFRREVSSKPDMTAIPHSQTAAHTCRDITMLWSEDLPVGRALAPLPLQPRLIRTLRCRRCSLRCKCSPHNQKTANTRMQLTCTLNIVCSCPSNGSCRAHISSMSSWLKIHPSLVGRLHICCRRHSSLAKVEEQGFRGFLGGHHLHVGAGGKRGFRGSQALPAFNHGVPKP